MPQLTELNNLHIKHIKSSQPPWKYYSYPHFIKKQKTLIQNILPIIPHKSLFNLLFPTAITLIEAILISWLNLLTSLPGPWNNQNNLLKM